MRSAARQDPLRTFKKALDNVKPVLEVSPPRRRRDLPGPGRGPAGPPVALAMRWLIQTPARGEKTMVEQLAGELLDAANSRGDAVKKREDTHRMAEANRAFAHYAGERGSCR